MQKQISEIVKNLRVESVLGSFDKVISGISYNSLTTKIGDIFFCLKGQHDDGIRYINDAIKNGACAIVTDRKIDGVEDGITVIYVKDVLEALGVISSNFYDNPAKKMLIIGVTGTNGKTTITYILESIFYHANFNCGVIGTINYRYNDKVIDAVNTTPFASDLQKILYDMCKDKIEVVVMEVSSHGLEQKRVLGCEFDVAIFSNLTEDHLDYHKTIDSYFDAKSILFKTMKDEKKEIFINSKLGDKCCIINIDDVWGEKLVDLCKANVYTYGKKTESYFKYANVETSINSTKFDVFFNKNSVRVISPLIAQYNVYNCLASFAAAYSQNVNVEDILKGIKNVKQIPGRFEIVDAKSDFKVIIDFAHTPDALKKVLEVIRLLTNKRIIVVFGCGGERDRKKRPIMGSIASNIADYVILTSDNPRNEDPKKIILDIEVGIKRSGRNNYEILEDREQAILRALNIAKAGDIVLLAGKGHESYQIFGNNKIPFSEKEIVLNALKNKRNK